MWDEMKVKWTNKEEKVWFMEAQKWTQHHAQPQPEYSSS
jgi:hypothetical protein